MKAQRVKLNLVPGGVPPVVYVSQYDVGRMLEFALYDGMTEASISESSVVEIRGTKPDNTGFSYACSLAGNIASIPTQEQMTVLAGEIECEIVLTMAEARVASSNFILRVERAGLRSGVLISETELDSLNSMLDTAAQSASLAADAATAAGLKAQEAVKAKNGAELALSKAQGMFRFENGILYITTE